MAVTADQVSLDSEYRASLDEVAPEQYSAEANGKKVRATTLRERLYDAPTVAGRGKGRVVIPIPDGKIEGPHGDYVAKLATPYKTREWGGIAQNSHEAALWEERKSKHLVPVVESDDEGFWLIMPEGVDVSEKGREFIAWRTDAENDLEGDVWEEDIRIGNTVTLRGMFRLCDYGIPPEYNRVAVQ